MKTLDELKIIDDKNVHEALEYLYDWFDRLFRTDNFEQADLILLEVNPREFSNTCLVGFLAITLCAQNKLKNRNYLFNRIRQELNIRPDTTNRVDRLLRGL